MKHVAVLYSEPQAKAVLSTVWAHIRQALKDGQRLIVRVEPEKRSNEQNRLLWAALTDVSEQVDWYGKKLTATEWKDVFTAALKSQTVVPGLAGGFVVVGASTSQMTKAELSDLMELIFSFGTERDVKFGDVNA